LFGKKSCVYPLIKSPAAYRTTTFTRSIVALFFNVRPVSVCASSDDRDLVVLLTVHFSDAALHGHPKHGQYGQKRKTCQWKQAGLLF
jgi:hypothetical protein